MNPSVRYLIASCFAAALAASPASAGVILTQPAINNGGGLISAPFNGGYIRGFDDFKLNGNYTITSVSWVGDNFIPGTGTFQVGFTTDASQFYPNTSLFVNETVTPTRTTFGTFQDTFTATLPTPVNLSANTDYWISIFSNAANWGWSDASSSPMPGALPHGIAAGYVSSLNATNLDGVDLAFSLSGNPTVPAPEPATLALFGAGLIGAAKFGRRKRK